MPEHGNRHTDAVAGKAGEQTKERADDGVALTDGRHETSQHRSICRKHGHDQHEHNPDAREDKVALERPRNVAWQRFVGADA